MAPPDKWGASTTPTGVVARLLHLGALEPKLGEALHIQEVRRPEVIVPIGNASIDAGRIYFDLYGTLGEVCGI